MCACVYHVSPRQCDKMGAKCSPLDSPTRCTDDTIHFERASCREKQCTVSGEGSKMCSKFTDDAAVLSRNVHMLRRTWERLPYQQQGNNTQQHTDHHSTSTGSWDLFTCPPYHTLCFYKTLVTSNQAVPCRRSTPACCGWQSRAPDIGS